MATDDVPVLGKVQLKPKLAKTVTPGRQGLVRLKGSAPRRR